MHLLPRAVCRGLNQSLRVTGVLCSQTARPYGLPLELQQSGSLGLVVISESDSRTLLIHRICREDIYQRQGGAPRLSRRGLADTPVLQGQLSGASEPQTPAQSERISLCLVVSCSVVADEF